MYFWVNDAHRTRFFSLFGSHISSLYAFCVSFFLVLPRSVSPPSLVVHTRFGFGSVWCCCCCCCGRCCSRVTQRLNFSIYFVGVFAFNDILVAVGFFGFEKWNVLCTYISQVLSNELQIKWRPILISFCYRKPNANECAPTNFLLFQMWSHLHNQRAEWKRKKISTRKSAFFEYLLLIINTFTHLSC